MGVYLIGDGSNKPYRQWRSPFVNLSVLSAIGRG